jgi:osmotically-inducible protein OsmY
MKHLAILLWLPAALASPGPTRSMARAESTRTSDVATIAMSDTEIADKVWAAIWADDILRYDAANMGISVRDGVVTLIGTVHRDPIRLRMAQVARHASGGSRVVNLVNVVPS